MKNICILLSLLSFSLFSFPFEVFAEENPSFYINNATGYADDEIEVDVSINNNPGIISFMMTVSYDTNALTLLEAIPADYPNLMFAPIENVPFKMSWFDGVNGNNTTNGVIARLKFKINEVNNANSFPLKIDYDPNNVFDSNENSVWFETSDGYITVLSDFIETESQENGSIETNISSNTTESNNSDIFTSSTDLFSLSRTETISSEITLNLSIASNDTNIPNSSIDSQIADIVSSDCSIFSDKDSIFDNNSLSGDNDKYFSNDTNTSTTISNSEIMSGNSSFAVSEKDENINSRTGIDSKITFSLLGILILSTVIIVFKKRQ